MRRLGQIACAAVVALYAFALVRTAWISDDAYITLRTVDNFVNGYGLRWNVAERVQSFTHPLWLFLISAFYFVTREGFYTTIVLSLVVSLAAVSTLALHRRRDPWTGVIVVSALLCSKCFVDYSTSGLENPLTFLLLAWFVILLPDDPPTDHRLGILALLTGLGMLTRTDNVLLFGPALGLAFVRHGRWRRGTRLILSGTAPLLAWHAFATLYYGIPYPNTALAKLNAGIPTNELLLQGWRYLVNSARADALTLSLIAFGVASALFCRRARSLSLAAGVVLYVAYVVRVGGDFMGGRFLAVPLLLSVTLLADIDWSAARWRRPLALCGIVAAGFAAPYPTLLSDSGYGMQLTASIDAHGIADERRYYFAHSGLLGGQPGWSRPLPETSREGRELRAGGVTLCVDGAIGFLGYWAGPGVHIVDDLALADPLLSRLTIVRRDPIYDAFLFGFQARTAATGWRPGHYRRSVPRGYLRSLAQGVNSIDDPDIARLYDDVVLLTRAPLLDTKRLTTIVRLLAGPKTALSRRARPEFTPVPWDELVKAQPQNPEALYERGEQKRKAGDDAGALLDYREVLNLFPGHRKALVAEANLYRAQGRWKEALVLLDRAVAIDPTDASAWRFRAVLLDALSRHLESIEALLRSAALDPQLSADMYANVGLEYSKLKKNEEAVVWLRRASAVDPRVSRTSLLLGKVLAIQGREEEAIAAFTRALSLEPSLERAALDLATVYVQSGRPAEAASALDRFLSRNPGSFDARAARERLNATTSPPSRPPSTDPLPP